jgi:hypothetical protein
MKFIETKEEANHADLKQLVENKKQHAAACIAAAKKSKVPMFFIGEKVSAAQKFIEEPVIYGYTKYMSDTDRYGNSYSEFREITYWAVSHSGEIHQGKLRSGRE